jgi:diguanylate cyclase (GGDEF)-like protein
VLVDLDHFKQVNDRHGHLVGDTVLVEVARRLTATAREEDVLARIGGEEFAWLLPECDAETAWTAAERARRAIAGSIFPEVGPVTMSAGVAELAEDASINEFFRAADAALYWAKDQGRDACVPYTAEHDQAVAGAPRASRLAPSVERLLALAREQLGLTLATVGEFTDDKEILRYVDGDAAVFGLELHQEIPLEETYCHRVMSGRLPNLIRDARREEGLQDLHAAGTGPVGAYVGVPITLPGGAVYGMLCCLSPQAEPALGDRDTRLLRMLASMIGEELDREARAGRARARQSQSIQRVLQGDGLSIVLQPIVNLADGRVVAAEALSRFDGEPHRGPDVWFAEASAVGLELELQMTAIRAALKRINALPSGARLSVNVSPSVLASPELLETFAGFPGERLAVELTEHTPVSDYAALGAAIASLRRNGIWLMIDDAGAGFSSLQHILGLHPDVIKLDVSLSRDIDSDPVRRALAASLVGFAREIGAIIVAEGIETQLELETLQTLGVTHGQGYHLAPPAPGPVPRQLALGGAPPVRGRTRRPVAS